MSVLRAPLLQAFQAGSSQSERREDERVALDLAGLCMISTKRDAEGNRREFACRVLDMSVRAMRIAVPVTGPVGDRVIVHTDLFGTLNGQIVRVEPQIMAINILAGEEDQKRLAAKLAWLKGEQERQVTDARRHPRTVPRRMLSTLTFASGQTMTCLVMDMSASGAAIAADTVPPIGTVVAVGAVVGRVKRHFQDGFAVAFVETQDPAELESRLMLH